MTNRQALEYPWGDGGTVVDPDTEQAGKYSLGWLVEKFPSEWHNFYYNKHDATELEVMANSNRWDAAVSYSEGAVVFEGSDLTRTAYTAAIANTGTLPSTNPTTWTPEPIIGMTRAEIQAAIDNAATQLSNHLATSNPHGDTLESVGVSSKSSVDSDAYWDGLSLHLQETQPHATTPEQLGLVPAVGGGVFSGVVKLAKAILPEAVVSSDTKGFTMATPTDYFGISPKGAIVFSGERVLRAGNMSDLRGESSSQFQTPPPILFLPLVSGVNSYTSITNAGWGDVEYLRPTTLEYTNKANEASTAEVDIPAIGPLGLKKGLGSTLTAIVPITTNGTIAAWVDGVVVAFTGVTVTKETNLLSFFDGESVRDLQVWDTILSPLQLSVVGDGNTLDPDPDPEVVAQNIVQIGMAIITPEDSVWVDSLGAAAYSLLPTNTAFLATEYPALAVRYPGLVTPDIPTETGAPFPYKIVGDLQ